MENLEKSWNFEMLFSRPGKVMEFCYINIFMSFSCAEFEIINMLLK